MDFSAVINHLNVSATLKVSVFRKLTNVWDMAGVVLLKGVTCWRNLVNTDVQITAYFKLHKCTIIFLKTFLSFLLRS